MYPQLLLYLSGKPTAEGVEAVTSLSFSEQLYVVGQRPNTDGTFHCTLGLMHLSVQHQHQCGAQKDLMSNPHNGKGFQCAFIPERQKVFICKKVQELTMTTLCFHRAQNCCYAVYTSHLVLLQSVVFCLVVHAGERDPGAGERGHCTGQGVGSKGGMKKDLFLQSWLHHCFALLVSTPFYCPPL